MRFSNDIYAVDEDLPELWDTLVFCAFDVRNQKLQNYFTE